MRNVIERIFGIIKKRFPIITEKRQYPVQTQINISKGVFILHNFIKSTGYHHDILEDEYLTMLQNAERENRFQRRRVPDEIPERPENEYVDATAAERRQAITFRDEIAMEMWRNYQIEIQRRANRN